MVGLHCLGKTKTKVIPNLSVILESCLYNLTESDKFHYFVLHAKQREEAAKVNQSIQEEIYQVPNWHQFTINYHHLIPQHYPSTPP